MVRDVSQGLRTLSSVSVDLELEGGSNVSLGVYHHSLERSLTTHNN
jgi:hypothetical protein